jgi:xylan 1,4-beta-xylosidase
MFIYIGQLLRVFCLCVTLLGCGQNRQMNAPSLAATKQSSATFNWFEYTGDDAIFATPLAKNEYQNPIVAGFYPDPSITRQGQDYYMVHSSFAYQPGLPILQSRDLVSWQLVGYALNAKSKIDLSGLGVSEGIFAPTLRYHQGVFYLITTAVGAGGNFLMTAADAAGPWSDPIWLPEIGGIDPDIFFDDDGRVYISHNDAPDEPPLYQGHRVIRLWEFDLVNKRVIKNKQSGRVIVNGGVDIATQPIWIEGPHLYKIDGWYYLLCAEGGTGPEHSQVVFRSKSLTAPFIPYAKNPILTQRDLPANRKFPVANSGHADLIQTEQGDWWAVFLATRPYMNNAFNTGRETFLLPVTWQEGWPVILPAGEAIPYRLSQPNMALNASSALAVEPLTGNFTWRDNFATQTIHPQWSWLGAARPQWFAIEKNQLRLNMHEQVNQEHREFMFLGRRQQHMSFRASTELDITAQNGLVAGLLAFQNHQSYYYLGLEIDTKGYRVFIEQNDQGKVQLLGQTILPRSEAPQIVLTIQGERDKLSFVFQYGNAAPVSLLDNADAQVLSSEKAGGFVGTMIGLYARPMR